MSCSFFACQLFLGRPELGLTFWDSFLHQGSALAGHRQGEPPRARSVQPFDIETQCRHPENYAVGWLQAMFYGNSEFVL